MSEKNVLIKKKLGNYFETLLFLIGLKKKQKNFKLLILEIFQQNNTPSFIFAFSHIVDSFF